MVLTDRERRIVHALGQTMFPRNRTIDLDADDVGVVDWVDEYVGRMPPFAAAQIRALLNTVDLGYGAYAMTPGSTFTSADRESREEYLSSWENASTYTQRQLFQALRAMMVLSFVDAPKTLERIKPKADDSDSPANGDA
ncbi:MAG: gluconate 2-dehydrogenase subunit 3 family protein [Myxococcota bacterium]